MEINKWVRDAREHKGLTQEQVGEALGVTKANVSGWETGRHEPSYSQMVRIAGLTGFAMPHTSGESTLFSSSLLERLQTLSAIELRKLEDQLRVQFDLGALERDASFTQTTGAKTTARKSSPGAPAAPSARLTAPDKRRRTA